MMLRAYFDDSGSEPQNTAFVLAGYIAPDRKWAQFNKEWAEALNKEPTLAYFKTAEAVNMRGEFSPARGWNRELRDDRIVDLAHVIWRSCSVAVSVVINHDDFRDTIKKLPTATGERTLSNDHPYAYLWYHLLGELWLHSPKLLMGRGPCNYTFDRQLGFEEAALRHWELLKTIASDAPCPPMLASWFGEPPAFADDKICLPLQAADLWAWSTRRALCHAPSDIKLPKAAIDRLCAVSQQRHITFTREHLIVEAHKAIASIKEFLRKSAD